MSEPACGGKLHTDASFWRAPRQRVPCHHAYAGRKGEQLQLWSASTGRRAPRGGQYPLPTRCSGSGLPRTAILSGAGTRRAPASCSACRITCRWTCRARGPSSAPPATASCPRSTRVRPTLSRPVPSTRVRAGGPSPATSAPNLATPGTRLPHIYVTQRPNLIRPGRPRFCGVLFWTSKDVSSAAAAQA